MKFLQCHVLAEPAGQISPSPTTRSLGWETKRSGIARPSHCLHHSLLWEQGGADFNKTFYSSREPTLHNHKTMRPTNHRPTCDAWKGRACCVARSPRCRVFVGERVTTTTTKIPNAARLLSTKDESSLNAGVATLSHIKTQVKLH